MQVGISTASLFGKYSVEDAPARIAAFGASICEVFLNTFSEYRDEFIGLLSERIHKHNLRVYSIHPMGTQFEPQLFSLHIRQREDAFRIYEQVLQAGRALGASCYVMHGPSTMYGAVRNMELERIGPIVQTLCEMAKEYGLVHAWENVSWCLFHEPSFGLRLLDATKADDLRFTLDIKQAVRSRYTPLEYIEAVGERLINLHICDYIESSNCVQPVLPGQGKCNLEELYCALLNTGYNGPAILEVYSDLYEDENELEKSFALVRDSLK